jgi:hypothetical protein
MTRWWVLGLLAATSAFADGVDFSLPRHGDIEIKVGAYTPWIDKEASLHGATPYADIFGGPMLLGEIEADHYFWDTYGTIGAGASIGYAEKYALVRVCSSPTSCGPNDGSTSDKTSLKVVPIKALGLYRGDYWLQHFGFPLVPYLKLGVVFNPWWSGKGSLGTDVATAPDGTTVTAQGGKWGAEVVAGVSFLLDYLEPKLAHDFYSDLGVVHTYLFAEFTYAAVNNFGGAGLNLSGAYGMFGITFEY